jgi:hypothetical protein
VRCARGRWAVALLLIALSACGSSDEVAHPFAEPPTGSYSASVFQVKIDGNTEPLDGATVSLEFFKMAQVRPLVWQRRLHSAPQVIGMALTVNDQAVRVIGVAEAGFAVPKGAKVWLPRIEQ